MRIGVDLRPFLRQETGIGIYFKNLLFSMSRLDRDNEYFLFSSSLKDRFPEAKVPRFDRMTFRDFKYSVRALNWLWLRWGWPKLDKMFDAELDLTHSPTPLRLPTRGKTIVTVHDLFALEFPSLVNREARLFFGRKIKSSLQNADGVIAVSRYIGDLARDRFGLDGARIKVIHHGMNVRFTAPVLPETKARLKERYGLPGRFLLFVGAQEPRKNLIRLIQAFRIIKDAEPDVAFVLAGPAGGDTENLKLCLERLDLADSVLNLDYVPEEDLFGLFRLAALFVLPSLCEGFGLPLLEAMASGLPIAASRAAAIPEIAGKAALFFDPKNVEEMAATILTGLLDESIRRSLIDAGRVRAGDFDWKRAASQTLAFYQETADR